MLTPSLKVLLCITGLILFSGCQSLQKKSASIPSVKMRGNWENPAKSFFKKEPIPLNGINLFHSSQWEEIVTHALAKNPDLQKQAYLVKETKQRFFNQQAYQFPSITGKISSQDQDNEVQNPYVNSQQHHLGLQADWEIDYLRKNQNQSKEYFFAYKASQYDYQNFRLTLIAQIARSWITAIEAKKQIESAEKNIQNYREHEKNIQESFRAGTKTALDLQLIKVDRALSESQIEVEKSRFKESLRSLNLLLGEYPDTQFQSLPKDLLALIEAIPVGIPSGILKRRPDIIAEEYRIQSHFFSTEVARKNRFPKISLIASTGTQSTELKDLLNKSHSFWNLATNLLQPIFEGGKLKAHWEAKKYGLEAQLANYQATILQALKEVENALGKERNLRQQLEKIDEADVQSRKAERNAWDNYQKGLIKIDTALRTQRTAISTQTQKYSLQGRILQNRVELFLALGGDWINPSENPQTQ